MKRFFAAIICILFVSVVIAQPVANKINVNIKAGKFNINNAKVTNGWKIAPVTAALGTDERKRDGFNTTHSYDNFGIVLFEKNVEKVPSGIISEVQFWFSAGETNAVTPSGLFTGRMLIEKLKVTRDLTSEVLKEKLADYTNTDSYMEHNYRLANKGLYIYFQFNEDETRLIKVSIGADTRPK